MIKINLTKCLKFIQLLILFIGVSFLISCGEKDKRIEDNKSQNEKEKNNVENVIQKIKANEEKEIQKPELQKLVLKNILTLMDVKVGDHHLEKIVHIGRPAEIAAEGVTKTCNILEKKEWTLLAIKPLSIKREGKELFPSDGSYTPSLSDYLDNDELILSIYDKNIFKFPEFWQKFGLQKKELKEKYEQIQELLKESEEKIKKKKIIFAEKLQFFFLVDVRYDSLQENCNENLEKQKKWIEEIIIDPNDFNDEKSLSKDFDIQKIKKGKLNEVDLVIIDGTFKKVINMGKINNESRKINIQGKTSIYLDLSQSFFQAKSYENRSYMTELANWKEESTLEILPRIEDIESINLKDVKNRSKLKKIKNFEK